MMFGTNAAETIRRWVAAVLLAGLPVAALAADATEEEPIREAPAVVDRIKARVSEWFDDVAFTDLHGRAGRLSDYRGKTLVLAFTGARCPVAKKQLPLWSDLAKAYADKNVAFVLANPHGSEEGEPMRTAAAIAGPQVRYVPDPEAELARTLGAVTTTEVFVFDAARTLVYRGALDDQFGLGYAREKPTRRYLIDALDATLAGRPVVTPATTAPGCSLDFGEPPKSSTPITFHNRVSRIVQNRCADCHRPGEAGPFNLLTYQDVVDHKAMIKKVVRRGTMPPWFADKAVGHWSNDLSLSEREKSDLIAWIDAGAPVGDPADAPLARTFVDGWRIGKPDAVFESPQAFAIPATGVMPYQHVVVTMGLTEDKWVKAVEIRPTLPQTVHHVLAFVKYPIGHPKYREQPRYRGGLGGYFAGLVPGQGHAVFPDDAAKFLPAGSVLIFQIHYTPNGMAGEDRPRIGLQFADKPPQHELVTTAAFNKRIRIPPGDANYEAHATYTFKSAARLLSFNPHAHVRGKAFRYDLLWPDGRSQTVLNVPRYDFNWQMDYVLNEPIDVPAGARLRVTAWYDNSDKNPANPDPTKEVHFGDQTWEEMMIGYFSGYRLGTAAGPAQAAQPGGNDEPADDEDD